MSIGSVTDRIQQIESQISQLQAYSTADSVSAAAFATALDGAVAARQTTGAGAASDVDSLPALAGGTPTTSERAVVDEARKYVGLPYVWGGTSMTSGVDCSGLVQSVYRSLGYDLPRLSADQARSGRPIGSMSEAKPGDLIAWDNSSRNDGADHIAIYIGDGKMIEAPRTGLDVRVVDVPSTPDYIRRILPDSVDGGGLDAARAAFDLQRLRSPQEALA